VKEILEEEKESRLSMPELDNIDAAVLILGGMIFCDVCKREANPNAPIFTDEEYNAQANKMRAEGWTSLDGMTVLCPTCTAVRHK
jgi:hypothetical protein